MPVLGNAVPKSLRNPGSSWREVQGPLHTSSAPVPPPIPRIDPGELRELPTPGDESALTIERGVDAIGPRLDELDPAIGQVVTPEEPCPEMVRDDLAEAIGMIGSPGALSSYLQRHSTDPHRCMGDITLT